MMKNVRNPFLLVTMLLFSIRNNSGAYEALKGETIAKISGLSDVLLLGSVKEISYRTTGRRPITVRNEWSSLVV